MKKNIYSFILTLVWLLSQQSFAQSFSISVSPQTQCYSANSNTAMATVAAPIPSATSYYWSAIGSNCPPGIITFSNGLIAGINYSCCGTYTILCQAYSGTVLIGSQTKTTVVNCAPILAVSGNTSICAGNGATLTASGASSYTWYTSQGTFTGSTIVLTPSATTCYSIIGTTSQGCMGYGGGCITVNPAPNPVINGNFNICSGGSATLSASGASSYTWFPMGVVNPTIIVTPSVTTCYTLVGYSCYSTASAVRCVTVSNGSSTIAVSGNTSICAGNGSTLTASGANTYTWYTSQGTFTGSSIVLTPSATTCYSIIGTTSQGCMGYGGGCISVNQAPNPVINGNFNVCNGGSTILSASGASSYTWFPGGTVSPTLLITPSVTTCYTLVGYSCYSTASAVRCVTVSNGSSTIAVSGNTSICAGNGSTLTASGANTYTWYTSQGTFTGSTIVLTPSATTCYSIIGTTSQGCMGYGGGCITVNPAPNPVINGNFNICSGGSATLSASGASSYTWFPGGTVSPTLLITPSVTTCYTLVGYSCYSTASAVRCVTVSNGSSTIAVSGNTSICAGNGSTLTASGANTYTWYTSQGTFTGSTIVLTPSATTCYSIIGTTSQGCMGYGGGCISVNQAPNPVINGNFNVCNGGSTILSASGASSYTWFPGGTVSPTLLITPSVTTCYTLVGYSCYNMASAVRCVTVQAGSTPTISVSGSSSGCAGTTIALTASGANTYTWLPGNLTGSTVVVTPTASTCYTVVGTSTTGCIGLGSKCIQSSPQPTLITSSGIFCAGDPGTLLAGGAASYTWLPYNQTGPSIIITPSVSGCYTVIGTSTTGCTSSVTGCFSVTPKPVVSISGNGAVCAGGNTTLTASGANSYTWVPFLPTATFVMTPAIVVSPTATSCYTVIGENSQGCISTAVKCVSVQSGAQINISGTNSLCAGFSANLLVSGASTYTWNTGSNSPFITVSPSVSTCYTVSGTTTGGCTGSAVKCISVQPSPVISVSGTHTICQGSAAVLIASGASSYIWGNGATSSSISVSPSVSSVYSVTGINGTCSSGTSVTVIVKPRPSIYIYRTDSINSGDSTICAGTPVSLWASGALTYTWSTGATAPYITVTPGSSSTYTVAGMDANGCTNSNVITLVVSTCAGLGRNSNYTLLAGIYPNPSSGKLMLQSNGTTPISYNVYDISGRELLKGNFKGDTQLDLSGYSNGSYLIRFESGSAILYKKIILEK